MEKKIDVVQMQADLSNFSSEYETIRHDDLMQVLSRLEQAEQDAYGFREGYEILKRALIKQGERLEQAEQAVQRVRELHSYGKLGYPNGDEEHYCTYDENAWPCETIRVLDGDTRRCLECNGTGDVQVRFNHGIQTQDCAVCFGTGDTRG